MALQDNTHSFKATSGSFYKLVLSGAGIAFLVICLFIFGVDEPPPEWGKFWRFKPLIITPLAGAMGGAFCAFMSSQVSKGFDRKLAVLICMVIYSIGLWLGIVLGLAGIMWD